MRAKLRERVANRGVRGLLTTPVEQGGFEDVERGFRVVRAQQLLTQQPLALPAPQHIERHVGVAKLAGRCGDERRGAAGSKHHPRDERLFVGVDHLVTRRDAGEDRPRRSLADETGRGLLVDARFVLGEVDDQLGGA